MGKLSLILSFGLVFGIIGCNVVLSAVDESLLEKLSGLAGLQMPSEERVKRGDDFGFGGDDSITTIVCLLVLLWCFCIFCSGFGGGRIGGAGYGGGGYGGGYGGGMGYGG